MAKLKEEPVPLKLTIRTMDFDSCDESLHASFWRDSPRASLGNSDVCFAVNAPLDYTAADTHSAVVFFLDPLPVDRKLPKNGYQVIYQATDATSDFRAWAEAVMPYLREALLGSGMVCTDFADFVSVLVESTSRRLRCELISYDHHSEIPAAKLDGLRFKTIFANLFGRDDLSLAMYIELSEALPNFNPHLAFYKLGLKFYPCEPPMLLLLGQPEADTSASLARKTIDPASF
jgi:hypothetical protein